MGQMVHNCKRVWEVQSRLSFYLTKGRISELVPIDISPKFLVQARSQNLDKIVFTTNPPLPHQHQSQNKKGLYRLAEL